MANTDKYTPYYKIKHKQQEEKLADLVASLPCFSECFFRELSRLENKAPSSLIAYAIDLKVFFVWAKDYLQEYADVAIKDLPIDILSSLHVRDIKNFLIDYVPQYTAEVKVKDHGNDEETTELVRKNSKTSAARKLATLKKFYHYYNNLEPDEPYFITNDPVSSVKQAKDPKSPIKFLDRKKTKELFDCISTGKGLTGKTQKWNEKTRLRDRAIVALFLGTGLRVSELAGINLQDIDRKENSITVFRKEQRKDKVFMNDQVAEVLYTYIDGPRVQTFAPNKENENALFISYKHNRMSVSAIERCVSKYTQVVTGSNEYTCHKLRDSFGTRLYAETGGNAKKVQVAMNHKSASTTLDFYIAAMDSMEKETTFKQTHIEGL